MTKALPANFSPELVTIMKSALDTAVDQIDRSNRNARHESEDGTADRQDRL
jgi:hypothetical protein